MSIKKKSAAAAVAAMAAMTFAVMPATPASAFSGYVYRNWDSLTCHSWFPTSEANYAGDTYDDCSSGLNDSVSRANNNDVFQDMNIWTDSYWRGTAQDIDSSQGMAGMYNDNTASSHEW